MDNLSIENHIIKTTCRVTGVSEDEIKSRSRLREIVTARQYACKLISENTLFSQREIGKFFGGMNHATVSHSIKTINILIKNNRFIRDQFHEIEELI